MPRRMLSFSTWNSIHKTSTNRGCMNCTKNTAARSSRKCLTSTDQSSHIQGQKPWRLHHSSQAAPSAWQNSINYYGGVQIRIDSLIAPPIFSHRLPAAFGSSVTKRENFRLFWHIFVWEDFMGICSGKEGFTPRRGLFMCFLRRYMCFLVRKICVIYKCHNCSKFDTTSS